jgi:hypothetical protein
MKQPFQFKDRRQERTYRRLFSIGPGPSAFYRDACVIMNEGVVLETQSHLVSHMVREIESALRDVLESLADRTDRLAGIPAPDDTQQASIRGKLAELNVPETDPVAQAWLQSTAQRESGTSQHRKEIQAILKGLEIAESDSTATAWLDLVGKLHGKAHRDALAKPRPVDDAFLTFWDGIQAVLDDVLDRYERRYIAVYDQLDRLLVKPVPDSADVETLKNSVPNNLVTLGYFFERLESPQWLVPLRRKGFFRLPPEPERNEEEGTIRFPHWPAARYLARMAEHDPQTVLEIVRELRTENGRVYDDFADAALALPPDKAAKLIPEAKVWLEASYQFLVGEKLCRLAVRLAQSGQLPAALDLARSLLIPVADPQARRNRIFPPEAKPRIRDHDYEKFLAEGAPQLIDIFGLPAFEILCDALDEAIRLSRPRVEEPGPRDHSYVRRPAIEDHEQNRTRWGILSLLITAIRDAAAQIVKEHSEQIQAIVSILDGHSWNVFKRLSLHLLQTVPEDETQLAAERLTDRSLFEEIEVWHEYGGLAREAFNRLTQDQQNTVLGWLESGPDLDEWKSRKQSSEGQPPTNSEAEDYAKIWRIMHIARLRDVIPTTWKQGHADLIALAEQYEYPDFLSYAGDVSWGPTSPQSADDMSSMSIQHVVAYLNQWEPSSGEVSSPTWDGLARALTEAVQRDPKRFSQNARAFQQLDEPTYINGLLQGLNEAAKVKAELDWSEIVSLCEWGVSQPREIPNRPVGDLDRDPDWGWTRQTIASLFESGFRTGSISTDLRFRVWGVLTRLMADPDPTPRHEERFGGDNMEPATRSLNTVRGRTMHAIMHYALWLRRQADAQAGEETPQKTGFDLMPEVRALLNAELDPEQEPSTTIRAVYGWYFPSLYWLDPLWANENSARVFPQDPQYRSLYEAAWQAYLSYAQGFGTAFGALRRVYEFAVSELDNRANNHGKGLNSQQRLAEHLIWYYAWGMIPLDEPSELLQRFFANAGVNLRAHAIQAMGDHLHGADRPPPEDMANRLVGLWIQRVEYARATNDQTTEIEAFGNWFASGKFDTLWSLRQLEETLKVAGKAEPYHQVLERLVGLSDEYPKEAVECLDLLVLGNTEGWETTLWQEEKRTILQNALESSDPVAQQTAKDLINRLSALGQLSYRSLLSP